MSVRSSPCRPPGPRKSSWRPEVRALTGPQPEPQDRAQSRKEESTMRRAPTLPVVLAALVAAIWLGAAPGDALGQSPRKGGVLRVGMTGEPPTLDAHATTTVITREIGINMFETLLAFDAKYQPVPHLVEGYDVLDGGRRYVFRLRRDVRF